MKIQTSLDKSFWSMHLNMATNNLLTVVQHLDKHFPKKKSATPTSELETDSQLKDDDVRPILESAIVGQLKSKGNIDTKRKIIRALLRRLPFLHIVQEFNETPPKLNPNAEDQAKEQERITRIEKEAEHALSPEGVAEALCYYAELLYSLRNYFTHASHSPVTFRIFDQKRNDKYPNRVREFMQNFDRIWTWNLRKVRQRFGYDDKTMIHLRKKIGKNDNPQFVCKFFEKDEDNTGISVFTERGLAFFAAQFLEPKYVALMFAQLEQSEGKNTVKALATLKTYQTSCIRLPKVRLETAEETTPLTLGMDTLVELHKCPDKLYSLLSQADQHLFRIDSGENNAPEDELFFKRHGNRFTYFALNYLDRTEKFKSMCFHIDLGNYFFDCYKKGLVDGTTLDERRIGKRIKTFQRIQDAEKDYRENRDKTETTSLETEKGKTKNVEERNVKYWIAEADKTPPEEYRQDMLPQYRCKKGNIGIYFKALHKGFPKVQLNGKNTHNPKADCILSLNELPFLTFLAVHGKAEEAQNLLVKYRQDWNILLQKIINGEPITVSPEQTASLPIELRHFIMTGTVRTDDIKKELKTHLTTMKIKTERLLWNFLDNRKFDSKPGKSKNYFNAGRIAQFLAADLVKLQRPNMEKPHQGKVTPPNFQVLQASLASFNIHRDRLPDIFRNCGLVENPEYPHPFLSELVNKPDLYSLPHFFEKYLKRKIVFLEECIKSDKLDTLHIGVRLQNRYEAKTQKDYIKHWAERKFNEPLNLPRGLFADLVEKLVKEKFPNEFEELLKLSPPRKRQCNGKEFTLPHNSAFFVQKFHEWSGDASQWFYDLPFDVESEPFARLGKIFCSDKRTPNPFAAVRETLKENYGDIFQQLKEKSKNFRKKNEQEKFSKRFNCLSKHLAELRQEKMQDMILFAMAKELLPGLTASTKLSDVKKVKSMRQSDRLATAKHSEDKNEKYLLDQETKLEFHYIIADLPPSQKKNAPLRDTNLKIVLFSEKMKIKKYGNFRRLTNDIRVPSLLRLLHFANKTNRFEYEDLEKELEQYETVRLEVFRKVHELERIVLNKLPSLRFNEDKTEKEYIDFDAIVKQLPIPDHKKIALHIFRNAFSHHYYPEFVFERDETKDKDVQDYLATAIEQQFRSKLIGKPLVVGELMIDRVLGIASSLFQEVLTKAKQLQESI
ncbi:MAG: type VI-B CRISPR-associated RNA-guided ribonuclease Cas13b [Planctomycetaceae bacterium]|jgi:hypothetical protein|nr:type VI-B CRISPR-associated RNA-guided ribonuclease Cas13b [Planctomycetaceae bacterium]